MELHEDGTYTFEIVTAAAIYEIDKLKNSRWYIKSCLLDFKSTLADPTADYDVLVQAWQYVKAYTQILKDWDEWDYDKGLPKITKPWIDMEVGSDEWNTYFRAHPDEQFSMWQYAEVNRKEKENA